MNSRAAPRPASPPDPDPPWSGDVQLVFLRSVRHAAACLAIAQRYLLRCAAERTTDPSRVQEFGLAVERPLIQVADYVRRQEGER